MVAKILIVEDDEALRESLVLALRTCADPPMKVFTAGDGKEALRIIEEEGDINVAVVDIFMPGVDGIEFIRTVRKTQHALNTLAISGGAVHIHSNYLNSARFLGAAAILTKPFRMTQFQEAVKKLLDGAPEAAE